MKLGRGVVSVRKNSILEGLCQGTETQRRDSFRELKFILNGSGKNGERFITTIITNTLGCDCNLHCADVGTEAHAQGHPENMWADLNSIQCLCPKLTQYCFPACIWKNFANYFPAMVWEARWKEWIETVILYLVGSLSGNLNQRKPALYYLLPSINQTKVKVLFFWGAFSFKWGGAKKFWPP